MLNYIANEALAKPRMLIMDLFSEDDIDKKEIEK